MSTMQSAYSRFGAAPTSEKDAPSTQEFEPGCTTCNYKRCWTIDYIWYDQTSFRPVSLLDIDSEEILRSEPGPDGWYDKLNRALVANGKSALSVPPEKRHGIPNSLHGSDHVPLGAEFEIVVDAVGKL